MGRPFAKELQAVPATVAWAADADVGPLQRFVEDTFGLPLLAIGSGGSSTAAHFAALLHRERHRMPARHATPLDVLLSEPGLGQSAVMLASASGRNGDVLAAFEACRAAEVPAVATVTTRPESPLAESARAYARSYVLDAQAPAGKDGYLATNSLVATVALLLRAYGFDLPASSAPLPVDPKPLRARPMVIVLHGGWGAPVATDLESKLNESALAAALVADYRNFGHGRHLWLARRAEETVVVALITPDVEELAERTLALVPRNVAVVRVTTATYGPAGTFELLVRSFSLVAAFADATGEDPGRPSVPEFGRKLYALESRAKGVPTSPVARKLLRAPLAGTRLTSVYEAGLAAFLERLAAARIGAVVMDYDGTLCTREDRFKLLRQDVAAACAELVAGGLLLGIATGRGRSVREALQKSLAPDLWSRVTIGYYNASEVGPLGANEVPNREGLPSGPLAEAYALLQDDEVLRGLVKFEPRSHQVSLEPRTRLDPRMLVSHVMTIVSQIRNGTVRVVASSHSVDVVTDATTKQALVDLLQGQLAAGCTVLTIGDRGAWPGNDFALLGGPLSLCVDDVSSDPASCWNIALPGTVGPDATLGYLKSLEIRNGIASYRLAPRTGKSDRAPDSRRKPRSAR
ncbi:MAG: hypothetical protein U0326_06510 [Polyangiales bacterium]